MKGVSAPVEGGLPPPHGPSGWVGVRLDREVDWDEVDAFLHDAYRKVGPKTLVKLLDAAGS